MANVIIVLILVVVVGIALKSTRKHMKGESSCCGGGGEIYQAVEDKKLDKPIIKEKVFKIKGMTCQHCVANVTRAINAIEGVSSQVNLKKEEAHVVYDRDVDDQVIIAANKQDMMLFREEEILLFFYKMIDIHVYTWYIQHV